MGSGGSGGVSGGHSPSGATDTNAYGGPGGGGSGPGYTAQANTPEVRTYKDGMGNTVKVYQTVSGGRLSALGYKEVYSPTGKMLSTTKPQASANNPEPRVPISGSRTTTSSGTGAGAYGVYSGPK